jgi:hypothetical protein
MPIIEKMVQTAKHTVNAIVDIQRALADASGGLDCDCFKKAMVSPERGAHLFSRCGETKKPPAKVSRPRRGSATS